MPRSEIEDFIRQGSVDVKETVRGHGPEHDTRINELKQKLAAEGLEYQANPEDPGVWALRDRETGDLVNPLDVERWFPDKPHLAELAAELEERINAPTERMGAVGEAPRHDSPSYRTPGGTNYRETVYTRSAQYCFDTALMIYLFICPKLNGALLFSFTLQSR